MRLGRHWQVAVLLAGFALLSLRLFWLIDEHAVNVFYWDQWDFHEALFDDASLWETFRWQHGPHRQGAGFLLTRAVAELSSWDTRADALMNGFVVWSAAALFLWLRRRLLGPLGLADLAIPLLVLSPAQYGIFLHTANASHGTVPLVLIALYGLALTIPSSATRITSLLVLNVLLVYTGFGLFAGVITPCFFAIDCYRARERAARFTALGAFVAAIASGASFFVGYAFDTGGPAPSGLEQAPLYPRFMGLMLANLCGVKGTGFVPTLIGVSVGIAACWIAAQRGMTVLRGTDAAIDRVIVFLIGFSLLFCLGTAIGRLETGFGMAQSSRYVPLTVPLLLGVILHCATVAPSRLRLGLQSALIVGLVAATFPMRASEASFMAKLATGKRVWVQVYRDTHEIGAADRAAGLRVYPWAPETTNLQQKLDHLEAQGLNLFKASGAASPLAR